MIKGLKLGLVFAACIFSQSASSEVLKVTSDNLKDLIFSKNERVSAARLEADSAKERDGLLWRSFLPSVEIYTAQESFKTGSLGQKTQPVYGVEARMNLFNGAQDILNSRVRTLEVDKSSSKVLRVSAEELEAARTLYWSILYLKEKFVLLEKTLEANRQNLISAQRRIKSGVATDSDRFEFEMKDVDLRREMAKTKLDLESLERGLKNRLGLGEEQRLSYSEAMVHDHDYESKLKGTAKSQEYLYKELFVSGEQQRLSSQVQGRSWWPRVDLFAAQNKYNERIESAGPGSTSDEQVESVVGVRATLSFSAGFEGSREAKAQAKEALALTKAAEFEKREMESQLKNQIASLSQLHDQVHEAEENIARAERYYALTQSEYNRGVKNSPDVLGASEKLFDMRHKRLEIIRDFQVIKAQVFAKLGE